METYNPGVFASLFAKPLGERLWAFVNEPETLRDLETATRLGHPAVESIEEQLLAEFGADVLNDRVKQMIGHMVRQVMERRGYVVAQQNVKVTNGGPFSRATRYKKRDDMTFHVFRNSADPRLIALTGGKDGIHLPVGEPEPGARWTYWKSFQGGLRGRIAFGLEDEKTAREDISRQGFHLYRMDRVLRAGNS